MKTLSQWLLAYFVKLMCMPSSVFNSIWGVLQAPKHTILLIILFFFYQNVSLYSNVKGIRQHFFVYAVSVYTCIITTDKTFNTFPSTEKIMESPNYDCNYGSTLHNHQKKCLTHKYLLVSVHVHAEIFQKSHVVL